MNEAVTLGGLIVPMTDMAKILDLDRYPLDRPDTADYAALVARCQADLVAHGLFDLAGLVKADALEATLNTVLPRFDTEAFTHERMHNIYFKREIPGLAPDHPALREVQTSNRTLCGDQVTDTVIDGIYNWPPLRRFIADVMQKPELFVMDDKMAAVNVMCYRKGQALNWHFDRSEFTTTLLIQAPSEGGAFEYRRDLRDDDDPNYDGVAKLLTGEDPEVRTVTLEPGTLNVFLGKNTAHRVTPSTGADPRVIAVLSYYEYAGAAFTDAERIGFFGRAK